MKYNPPKVELVLVDEEDVIRTSPVTPEETDPDPGYSFTRPL